MDILTALDAEFLHVEDDVTPMHIGGVATFAGPAPTYDELVGSLEAKLHLIPRYRQRVQFVPLELGRPAWVDDEHFSTRFHVHHTAIPAPGDDAALTRLVGRLMSHRLDRNRPLWEIWLVEGLDDDRWALIFKVHHCMVDGVAGVALLGAVLDLDPAARLPEAPPWQPDPAPSALALVGRAWSEAVGDAGRLLAGVPGTLARPTDAARQVADAARGLAGFGRHLVPTPHVSIEGTISPHRCYAHAEVTIADIKKVRVAFGGTLNDVVLACLTKGYRTLLEAHGDDPARSVIRTGVPVSLRGPDGDGVPDNRVSTLLIELPVHLADPLERLETVRAVMAEAKASHMSEVGEQVAHLADLAPPMAMGTVSRLAMRAQRAVPQRSVTTVTTNVPGPQFPLYCLGRRMIDYLPYVPISEGVRVGTAILSYDGRISFGVTGDDSTCPDVGILARATADALAELVALADDRPPEEDPA